MEVRLELKRGDCVQVRLAVSVRYQINSKYGALDHVVVVQGRQRSVQKNVMHVQSCFFARKTNSKW